MQMGKRVAIGFWQVYKRGQEEFPFSRLERTNCWKRHSHLLCSVIQLTICYSG